MKNMVMYYYNLKNLSYYKQNNKNFFRDKNNIFVLEPISDKNKIIDIYKVTNSNSRYYKILMNVYNSIFTNIYGRDYILIQKKNNNFNLLDEILNFDVLSFYDLGMLPNLNWANLWEMKIDYYEYQMKHMLGIYPLIDESFSYFIGMGETAISYFRYNVHNYNGPLVISHKRIDKDNYFNPLNVVFDYRARDISEYLKYIFWNKKLNNFDLTLFLKQINFDKVEFIMLFSRMIFPSFYFDVYDSIINNSENQNNLIYIIKNIERYNNFLVEIYNIINRLAEIPKVDWL